MSVKACRKTRAKEFCLWVEGFFRLAVLLTFAAKVNGEALLSALRNKQLRKK